MELSVGFLWTAPKCLLLPQLLRAEALPSHLVEWHLLGGHPLILLDQ